MSLLEAIETLLDATADLSDQPHIRRARRKLQKRADTLRVKRQALRERSARLQASGVCTSCDGRGFTWAPGSDGLPGEKRCSSCAGNGFNQASEATNQPKDP